MKNLRKLVAYAGASALAIGVSTVALAGSKVEDDVRAFYEEATAEYLKCDPAAVEKYSDERKTGFYPDSLELYDETSDAAEQEAKAFCEGGGKHELTYTIGEVIPLKNAAVVLGTGHYKRTEPGGEVSIDSDYSFTELLVKTKDGWKFRHSHIGVAMPMGDEMAATEETASTEE